MNKTQSMERPSFWGMVFVAARPKTLSAAVVPIMVATSLALSQETIRFILPLSALAAALLIQIATNIINDALDFKKGTDNEERIGSLRITQQGWLKPNQVLAIGALFLVAAAVAAIPLMLQGGAPLVAVVAISLLCAYLYTGGPYPLAYVGLGDLFVLIFFGWVATGATYYVETGRLSFTSLLLGTQIGLLATVMIVINNMRDHLGDAKSNKRTTVVRFGLTFARIECLCLLITPYLLTLFLSGYAALLPWLASPLACGLLYLLFTTPPSSRYNAFLGIGGLHHLLFGTLLTIGILLS